MQAHAGVVREAAGLQLALDRLDALCEIHGPAHPLVAARLILAAALAREESRGAHFRSDFPACRSPAAHASSREPTRTLPPLPDVVLEPIVKLALAEDLGVAGDVTTDALIDPETQGRWALRAREAGVVAGLDAAMLAGWMHRSGHACSPSPRQTARSVKAGDTILEIEGAARSVLMAERTMLNFIGRLSGVATLTRAYVDAVAGMGVIIASTRKTTPGLRALEKRAVRLGGGGAHRYGLDDAILIKDNHIAAAGGVAEAMQRARAAAAHLTCIEIEVDDLGPTARGAAACAERDPARQFLARRSQGRGEAGEGPDAARSVRRRHHRERARGGGDRRRRDLHRRAHALSAIVGCRARRSLD